jgi:hypothetical protein
MILGPGRSVRLVPGLGSVILSSSGTPPNVPGTYKYTRIIDGTDSDEVRGVTCDSSGNVYIVGNYRGSPTIKDQNGTTVGTLPTSSGGVGAVFVCKFNSSGTYQYSRIIDGDVFQSGLSVSCDSSGNMYIAGIYTGTSAIKDQDGTTLGTLPTTNYNGTAFVSKFDSSGAYQYSRIVDSVNDYDQGSSVTCDSSGNMYLAGIYTGTPTIKDQDGNTLGTLPASASNTNAAFVCKFNSSGDYQYTRIIDSTGGDAGSGVTCDSSGNVYLTGRYIGTPLIKDQANTTLGTLPASVSITAFVSKFDSVGTYQYTRVIDTTGNDVGFGVACDSTGNMYIAGAYSGTPLIKDQDGTTLGTLPASAGSDTAFVSKFDSSGTYQYSRIVDGSGTDQGNGVACDPSGNMYIAGYYNQTPTIKDQDGTTLGTLPASGSSTAFVSKFDSSGNYLYSRIIDSAGNDIGYGVSCDSSGNMYFAGIYIGTPTIKDQDGIELGTLPSSINGNGTAFVCKFS